MKKQEPITFAFPRAIIDNTHAIGTVNDEKGVWQVSKIGEPMAYPAPTGPEQATVQWAG